MFRVVICIVYGSFEENITTTSVSLLVNSGNDQIQEINTQAFVGIKEMDKTVPA